MPHMRSNAGNNYLLATLAALDLFGLDKRTTDMFFRGVLIVVLSTARTGAEHGASDLCNRLGSCNLIGEVRELARLRTVP